MTPHEFVTESDRAARACHSALSHGGIRHCKGCPHRQHPRPRRRVSRPGEKHVASSGVAESAIHFETTIETMFIFECTLYVVH